MEQNYKNHSQIVPFYHYVTYFFVVASIGFAFMNVGRNWNNLNARYGALALCMLSLGLLLITFYARNFALKAQDRAIRAEENMRHYVLTGKPLDPNLRMGQIIALRFAKDSQFIALAEKAVREKMRAKEIKQAILDWRADHYRV